MVDGVAEVFEAPMSFVSEAGVRKVLYIEEDMLWTTVHPTDETDIEKLENELIEKSTSFLEYEKDLKKLQLEVTK